MNIENETQATLDAYTVEKAKPSFGANCLLARRLVEQGVLFVQLYHTNWDHHGCSYCDRHLLQVQPNRTRQDRRNNSKQEIPTGTGIIT